MRRRRCNACRALAPKVAQLMRERPDVVFLQVNVDASKELARGLNIKLLPYFHFYSGAAGRVEAFSASTARIVKFKEALERRGAKQVCSVLDWSAEIPGVPEFPEVRPISA